MEIKISSFTLLTNNKSKHNIFCFTFNSYYLAFLHYAPQSTFCKSRIQASLIRNKYSFVKRILLFLIYVLLTSRIYCVNDVRYKSKHEETWKQDRSKCKWQYMQKNEGETTFCDGDELTFLNSNDLVCILSLVFHISKNK